MSKLFQKVAGATLFGGGVSALLYGIYSHVREKPKAMLPALPTTKKEFISTMALAIGNSIPAAGKKLAIAWAAFESDWGRTTGYRKANNPWNITAGSKWKGETVPGPDTEYSKDGKVSNITQQWRKYPSLAAAVSDLGNFLSSTNDNDAAGWNRLLAGDTGFTDSLSAGHYYTLPADEYKAGVVSLLADVNAYAV